MKSKLRVLLLLFTILLLGGASIFVALYLNQGDIAPDDSSAAFASCSGQCNSGSECTVQHVGYTPSNGKMFSCHLVSGSYRCIEEDTNAGGSSCYLACPNTWTSCGCNINQCKNKCEQEHEGETGTFYYTHICDGCKQPFTCSCTLTEEPTDTPTATPTRTRTPTPTRTNTPTATRTNTPTPTRTNTPTPTSTPTDNITITVTATNTFTPTVTVTTPITVTVTAPVTILPPTAIIDDQTDKLILGALMIIIGIFTYKYVSKNSIYSE